jgi:hypothetical protein
MHGGWQLFSPTLLVEVEESLLIRWVALDALASVWRREKERNTRARLLTSPHRARARRGVARRGDGRGRTMCA